jgi:hypothetical protein
VRPDAFQFGGGGVITAERSAGDGFTVFLVVNVVLGLLAAGVAVARFGPYSF